MSEPYVHLDYAPSSECSNPDTYGEICVKCGQCGRKFKGGLLISSSEKPIAGLVVPADSVTEMDKAWMTPLSSAFKK
jgi:hypothetical protein